MMAKSKKKELLEGFRKNDFGFLGGKSKIFLAVVGVLIAGVAFYIALKEKTKQGLSFPCLASSKTLVTKVLDGDTVIVEGGHHIRLLGIDADEKGYPCYRPAKEYLEKLVLNKKVRLEKDATDVDQYDRCLRYIFLGQENVNLWLVKQGLAIARFYPPDLKYQEEIAQAEKEAIKNKIGCRWN